MVFPFFSALSSEKLLPQICVCCRNVQDKGKQMYALVEILGKQYKAEEGKKLIVDKLSLEEGASYESGKVLAVVDGENARFGAPYVEGAKVLATVVKEFRGEKVKVYKFRRRKGY